MHGDVLRKEAHLASERPARTAPEVLSVQGR
jgi:hypothetical protein